MIEINCFISKCQKYRWSLDLKFSNKTKEMIFIGVNPSLSSNVYLDNTTKKILRICDKNNYGKIKLINLFGLISKNPKLLSTHNDPVGSLNNNIIRASLRYWSKNLNCNLWLGWGNNGVIFNRNKVVYRNIVTYFRLKRNYFNKPTAPLFIKITKSNNPIHPLYCSDSSKFKEFCIN